MRTVFAQPDQGAARAQLGFVARTLERDFPRVAALLREAGEDVITHTAFPQGYSRRIHSTNALERVPRELKAAV